MLHYKWAKQPNIGSWNVSVITRISFACFCDFISLTLKSPRIDLKTTLYPNELLLMIIAEPWFSAIFRMTIDI